MGMNGAATCQGHGDPEPVALVGPSPRVPLAPGRCNTHHSLGINPQTGIRARWDPALAPAPAVPPCPGLAAPTKRCSVPAGCRGPQVLRSPPSFLCTVCAAVEGEWEWEGWVLCSERPMKPPPRHALVEGGFEPSCGAEAIGASSTCKTTVKYCITQAEQSQARSRWWHPLPAVAEVRPAAPAQRGP